MQKATLNKSLSIFNSHLRWINVKRFFVFMSLMFSATFAYDIDRGTGSCGWELFLSNNGYYGDSLLAIYQEIPSFERFKVLRDSLHRYYMTHPDEPIEHREFYEEFFEKGDDLLKVARMEWDLLLKESILLNTVDSIFDSVYEANHSQIMDSLNRLSDYDRRIIQYALLVREFNKKDYASVEKMHVGMKIQALQDTIDRDAPVYGRNETNKTMINLRRQSRRDHQIVDFYLGFGIVGMHLFGQDSSNSAESLGFEFLMGKVTVIGDFVLIVGEIGGLDSDKRFFGLTEAFAMYRPNLPFGYLWSVQPEFGVGWMYSGFDVPGFVYSTGVRFEKSMNKPVNTLTRPAGYINGWGIGLTALMNYANLVGVKVDLRWAIH
ncbi:MAG: hypothetical protein II892_03220 [Fibrobacter sp.]|nr:hypothetical protein [Fibrobacter sp.]